MNARSRGMALYGAILLSIAASLPLSGQSLVWAEKICPPTPGLSASPQQVFGSESFQIVADGSFEAGIPNPFWTEFSTNFGTPLCNVSTCGTGGGTGPRTGDWWVWFGGTTNAETGFVSQDVVIPPGPATLTFWLEMAVANTSGFMEVRIDDAVIFSVTNLDAAAYPVYTEVNIDISSFADGQSHTLMFFSTTDAGGAATNFFVDDVSIEVGNDPDDPNPPTDFRAYSDFQTPTAMQLTWTDPQTYVDGDPLTNFAILIERDGVRIDSVDMGSEAYSDTGLTDGQFYEYVIVAKDFTDSTSTPVSAGGYAGGSPTPAPPANLICHADTAVALLTWSDPVTQSDGTPLDDLDSLRVYRDGVPIAAVAPGVQTFTDQPPPGFIYTYTLTAVDNETPPHESLPTESAACFVGPLPDFLIWVGPTAGGSAPLSGDSILAALAANGERALLTNDLFELGTDLSIFEGIFVVLGIFPANHLLAQGDAEGPALEAYLQNGGRVYLEAGDAFNFDPEAGGYNIRPWFGLNDGPDGAGDVNRLRGINDLDGFEFAYGGDNRFMDKLQPQGSTPVWQNESNGDISGVFHIGFGSGRSFGVVPAFGGLSEAVSLLLPVNEAVGPERDLPKSALQRTVNRHFVKKTLPPAKNPPRISPEAVLKRTAAGVRIAANTQTELMAAYLTLFRSGPLAPRITVAPPEIRDTLLIQERRVHPVAIANTGGTLAGNLVYQIAADPAVPWLTVSADSGTVPPVLLDTILVTLDGGGLSPGSYRTTLEIRSNDPEIPETLLPVYLEVLAAPVVGFAPDSLHFVLDPGQQDSAALSLFNSGAGTMIFSLTPGQQVVESFGATTQAFSGAARDRGNIIRVDSDTQLLEYRQYLDLLAGTLLHFFVYEGDSITGTFARIFEKVVTPGGTGANFYSSGAIRVPLRAGKFYYLGVSWGNTSVVYFRGVEVPPLPAAFGALESGVSGSLAGFPPAEVIVNNFVGFPAYFCEITTGLGMLSFAPPAGTVPPGDSSVVVVRADATRQFAGLREDAVQIHTNDPFTPLAEVPVLLTVNPLAIIGVSPDTLQFDALLVGSTQTRTVTVHNTGSIELDISDIASSDAQFSPNLSTLRVPPLGQAPLEITFAPGGPGIFSGYITLASNDPATPLDSLWVSGEGRPAPLARLEPDSFVLTIDPDQIVQDTLTIYNDGAGVLEFLLAIDLFHTPGADRGDAAPVQGRARPVLSSRWQRGAIFPAGILPGDAAAHWDVDGQPEGSGRFPPDRDLLQPQRGEEIFGSTANAFPGGMRGRGNLFTCTNTRILTEHRLFLDLPTANDLQFIVAEGSAQSGPYRTVSVTELRNAAPGTGWYSSGPVNVILQEGKFYLILTQWAAEATYFNAQNISPYPIPASFGELTAGAGWDWLPPYAVPPPAEYNVPPDAFGSAVAYYQTLVTEDFFGWLRADTLSGVVAPHSRREILLTFDPAGLVAGDYHATLRVSTNDPQHPELSIGAAMHLTGRAGIAVAPVVFPRPVFVNGTDSTGMWIRNTGNGPLIISDIASDNPVFQPADTALVVPGFDSVSVTVHFAPLVAGAQSAGFTIFSNDPQNPVFAVPVSATAVPGPAMAVQPDSVAEVLPFGDSTDVTLRVANNGGSDLLWSVRVNLGNTALRGKQPRAIAGKPGEQDVLPGPGTPPGEAVPPVWVSTVPWDLQFVFDVQTFSGATDNAGAEFDGTYFYVTGFATNLIHKYDVSGKLLESFSIPGVSNLRDLAFDGTYMYGGRVENQIYQMDFRNKTLLGTIPSPVPVRHIAYHADADAFFVGDNATAIALVDRNGAVLQTIPAAVHQGNGTYSSAYDNVSPGGPYLWIFSQNGTVVDPPMQRPNTITQLQLPSGQPTGFAYDVVPDLAGNGVLLAGGLFISPGIVPGKVTIGGVAQITTGDVLFGYELTDAGPRFMQIIGPAEGVVPPGEGRDITLRLYGLVPDTLFSGSLEFASNDPVKPTLVVPVILRTGVVGIEEAPALPARFAISPNYPNPFNPSTQIDFQLPAASRVTLAIYNVLGQRIRTLVDHRLTPGHYRVTWDARNDNGAAVASGIYIFQFVASSQAAGDEKAFRRVQKMMLLK